MTPRAGSAPIGVGTALRVATGGSRSPRLRAHGRGGRQCIQIDRGEVRVDVELTGQLRRVTLLVGHHQGHDHPVGTGAARATRAVDEILRVGGQVEVHHTGHIVDVDAAGGDIGCDQHVDPFGPEFAQRPVALFLGAVPVDRRAAHPGPFELPGDPVGAVLECG